MFSYSDWSDDPFPQLVVLIGLTPFTALFHLIMDPSHEVNVKRLQAVACWCDEVEASVDQGIGDLGNGDHGEHDDNSDGEDDDDHVANLHPLHPGLPLQVGVKLLFNVGQDWSPAAPERSQ